MDGSSDFSFYKGNSLANDGELGSPKAWPQLSSLNISEKSENSNVEQPDKPVHDENVSRESSEVKIKEVKSTVDSSTFKQPVATAQPRQRTKVPFEKGFSQMAWMKLTHTHPDLAGLKGSSNRRIISMDELKKHKSEGDSWTVLRGRVYNISPYLKFHPGGVDMLMKAAGKDCTALFNKYHAWVNAEFLLEKCLVGILEVPN